MEEAEVEGIRDLLKFLRLVKGWAEPESTLPDLQLLIQCHFCGTAEKRNQLH